MIIWTVECLEEQNSGLKASLRRSRQANSPQGKMPVLSSLAASRTGFARSLGHSRESAEGEFVAVAPADLFNQGLNANARHATCNWPTGGASVPHMLPGGIGVSLLLLNGDKPAIVKREALSVETHTTKPNLALDFC